MEAQVSNIFLSIWNQQKNKSLGNGPSTIPEQGAGNTEKFCNTFWQIRILASHFVPFSGISQSLVGLNPSNVRFSTYTLS